MCDTAPSAESFIGIKTHSERAIMQSVCFFTVLLSLSVYHSYCYYGYDRHYSILIVIIVINNSVITIIIVVNIVIVATIANMSAEGLLADIHGGGGGI